MASTAKPHGHASSEPQETKETQVGITEFVNPRLTPFSGVLKKR